MEQQSHYVGLDVSLETTSICVIDDAGAIIWRGKVARGSKGLFPVRIREQIAGNPALVAIIEPLQCSSDPDTITAVVRQHAPGAVRVGLETGQLSN
jgi:transposase